MRKLLFYTIAICTHGIQLHRQNEDITTDSDPFQKCLTAALCMLRGLLKVQAITSHHDLARRTHPAFHACASARREASLPNHTCAIQLPVELALPNPNTTSSTTLQGSE